MHHKTGSIPLWCGAASILLLGTALWPQGAWADRRTFSYSYGYMTLPAGAIEGEHYLDAKIARRDNPSTPDLESTIGANMRHMVEVEYGITDHWDFGLYNVFEQKQFGRFSYRGIKLRSRYRFGEEGKWFVDPAVYGELVVYLDEVKLEEVLILSKRFFMFEVLINLKAEQEWKIAGPDRAFKLELVPSAGFAWHINQWVAVGVEYVGKVEVERGLVSHSHYVGPSLSLSGKRFYWSLGFHPEVASSEGRRLGYQARSLFGLVF